MTQEALKIALDALETELSIDWTNNDEFNTSAEKMYEAIAAIKKALAQEQEPVCPECKAGVLYECVACSSNNYPSKPEQKPAAWMDADGNVSDNNDHKCFPMPLYTALPERTWAGLTDDEMENTFVECGGKWNGDFWKIEDADFHPFLRTIEAKHKEKNHDIPRTNQSTIRKREIQVF